MLQPLRVTLAVLAIHTLVLSSTASANTDVVADAEGDVAATAPAYVDIVQAKVTEQVGKGTLYFKMELAGKVPETPGRFVAFNWLIDAPGGFTAPFVDFVVVVRWCSEALAAGCGPGPAHWESFLVNNRVPSGTVGAFPFKIDGPTVKAYVDPALLGDPAGFNWFGLTRLAPAASGIPPADFAPDTALSSFTR